MSDRDTQPPNCNASWRLWAALLVLVFIAFMLPILAFTLAPYLVTLLK